MFKKILIGLAVIIVALLGYAATKPDTFRVERSASIKAAPETIFAHLNDFRSWGNWSPWEKLDPAMQRTFSGAAVGTGAVYEWKGNSEVGAGRMEILESSPSSKLNIKLNFTEPFEAQSTSEFSLTPEGDATKITWVMQGPNQFIGKVMSIFVNMDTHVGKDFETGLANLKTLAEAGKQDIVLTRIFDAPLEAVWKAWTEPEQVMKWWGPTGFTSPSCKIDFREGGKFIFHMRAPQEMNNADFYTAGVYKKIVPAELIEFTQGLSDKDGNKINPTTLGMPADFPEEIPSLLAFKNVDGKTELTAIEYGWTLGEMREMSKLGLEQCLDKLAESLK
ncbi:SRPBCC domain-containing protein [candidate division KSB1 bacterium]|nr:SRPBCC domain-containing protein [candidate division KSB1 bacterium]